MEKLVINNNLNFGVRVNFGVPFIYLIVKCIESSN